MNRPASGRQPIIVTDERRQCKRANADRGHVHKSLDLNGPSAGDDLQNTATVSTVNNYLGVPHKFVRYAICKRKLMAGSHPAATARQAELHRLPKRSPPVPSMYPDQINAIIEVVPKHHDRQIVHRKRSTKGVSPSGEVTDVGVHRGQGWAETWGPRPYAAV